ncbi:hypothetical protein CRG98_036239 [Punica granatum]|uniref:Tf2-1-like SH3-like domain-containing protein n=1 Tax=Punica granatum TaxID=22663 RepID=A0A2I0II24_PUNGR|nr:hypothetical protein CRG98_036239 [Punica granatum]
MASGAKLTAKRSSAASFSLGWREFVLESSSSELCLLYTSKFKPIGVRIDLLNDLHRTNLSCSELVVVTSRKSILRKDSPIKIANFKLYVPSPSLVSKLLLTDGVGTWSLKLAILIGLSLRRIDFLLATTTSSLHERLVLWRSLRRQIRTPIGLNFDVYKRQSSDDDDSRTNSLHPGENDAAEDLDRFSAGDYHKLAARTIGPVEIVEKINSNAYRLKLPSRIRTADVFSVKHLIPYTGDSLVDDDSRTNSLHPGENDAAEDLDRFSAGDYHKLAARTIGPVEIVEKINSNAYRLKLPSRIRTADVFSVKHLIPYTGDSLVDDDSRTNSLHPGENDAAEDLDRFSAGDYHKLAARTIGPVEIVEKINSNAYRLKLPSRIRTADVFSVKHLIPYTGDSLVDDDSRTNSLHPGENDAAEDLDRFSAGDYHKLAARTIGPVEIVEKINSNAYRLKLPSRIRTADVFSVKHLIPYTGDSLVDDDSRTNSLHPGENDAAEDLVFLNPI